MADHKDLNSEDLLDRAVHAVLGGPIPDELPPDRVAQLAALVRQAADQPELITLTGRIRNMRTRTRIAVAAAVLIASVGLMSWLAPGGGAALAFVNVAEALTKVRSARWKSTTIVKRSQGEAEIRKEIGMFLAPCHERTEADIPGVPDGQSISICSGRKATHLSTPLKRATVMDLKVNMEGFPDEEGPFGRTFLGLRQLALNAQSDKRADAEPLGIEVIDGRRAVGFRIRHGHGETTIWADPKTSLPIRVERAYSGETEISIVMTDFEIDPDLDESLFSLDVPEGYSVNKMQLEFPKSPLMLVAKAFGMAAEMNDGVFPPALLGEQGLEESMPNLMKAYLQKKFGKDPAEYWKEKLGKSPAEFVAEGGDKSEIEKATSEMLQETAEVSMVMAATIAMLQGLSPRMDWHYAGKDVKLNTPNRPIFWMKAMKPDPNSGKYEVIYADLTVKEVAPEDVPKAPESESSATQ